MRKPLAILVSWCLGAIGVACLFDRDILSGTAVQIAALLISFVLSFIAAFAFGFMMVQHVFDW